MRAASLVVALSVFGSGCVVGEDADEEDVGTIPVVGGGNEAGFTSAVQIVFAFPNQPAQKLCSAVMISAREALTAAHCVEAVLELNASGANILLDAGLINDGSASAFVTRAVAHPYYHQFLATTVGAERAETFDIGLLTLSAQPQNTTIAAIAPSNAFKLGGGYRVVGYGEFVQNSTADRRTSAPVSGIDIRDRLFFGKAGSTQTTCFGDSGGPLFNSAGQIAGLVLGGEVVPGAGQGDCKPGGFNWYTPITDNTDFIDCARVNPAFDPLKACVDATAVPRDFEVVIQSPASGTILTRGSTITVTGYAVDLRRTEAVGIDSVLVGLDSPTATAARGQTSTAAKGIYGKRFNTAGWTIAIPANLPVGAHTIQAKATRGTKSKTVSIPVTIR